MGCRRDSSCNFRSFTTSPNWKRDVRGRGRLRLLAGFQQYGLNPGPLLFAEKPDLVWGLIASLFIANAMLLVLNLPLVGLWVRLLAIPQPRLYAGILVFATMSAIVAKPSVVELGMLASACLIVVVWS